MWDIIIWKGFDILMSKNDSPISIILILSWIRLQARQFQNEQKMRLKERETKNAMISTVKKQLEKVSRNNNFF